ncbi:MAG: 3-deoxy-7-phosphoheptulonate synthase, partial [Erysipelotrichaceae bacterium]|nr:3-deoxy-7-phosphoheptulonate synthase [Erysipelotrichaceae bacterium]
MIITVKKNASKEDIRNLIKGFENRGLSVTEIQGESFNVFGLVGDTSKLDERLIKANPFVENVTRIAAPYKKANRLFHPEDSVIDVAGIKVGGKEKIVVIGGPCSVEGNDMICRIAQQVKAAGGVMLRGGAYKPRTSPYAFQGMGS